MKKTVLLYLSLALVSINCSNTAPQKNDLALLHAQDKELLQGIQNKIFDAFVQTNIQKDPKALIELKGKLEEALKEYRLAYNSLISVSDNNAILQKNAWNGLVGCLIGLNRLLHYY